MGLDLRVRRNGEGHGAVCGDPLNHQLVRLVALPDLRERLISIGMVPETGTPRELATNIRTEVARWGPIVKAAGIAPQ